MLVRYIGQKPGGCPVKVPVGLKSHASMKLAKTVWLRPIGELPDAEAIKLCALDPNNFELVDDGEVVPEQRVEQVVSQGTEIDPDRGISTEPEKKKRGRRTNAQIAAMARAKEANA